MNEAARISAQYLNGLAVAIISVISAAFIAGTVTGRELGLGAVASGVLHVLAFYLARRGSR